MFVDSGRLRTETLNLPESTMALKIEAPTLPPAWFYCHFACSKLNDMPGETHANYDHILDYLCHICDGSL